MMIYLSEDVEIREIESPDYNELSSIVKEIYDKNIDQGEKEYTPEHMKILLNYFFDENLVVGAYKGDEIVGATFGSTQSFLIKGATEAKGCYIDLTVSRESIQRQGIGTRLIKQLVERAKRLGYDFAFGFPMKRNKPAQKIMKKLEFANIGNIEPRVRALDPDRLTKLSVPAALRLIAGPVMSIASRMPKKRVESGTFREAEEIDYPKVLELLHTSTKKFEISRKWDLGEYKAMAEAAKPLKFKQYLWEEGSRLVAVGTSIDEHIIWTNDDAYVTYFRHLAFDKDATPDEKKRFIAEMLYLAKGRGPVGARVSNPSYIQRALSSAGFMGDRHIRYFMIRPLSEIGEEVKNIRYIREHYMNALF